MNILWVKDPSSLIYIRKGSITYLQDEKIKTIFQLLNKGYIIYGWVEEEKEILDTIYRRTFYFTKPYDLPTSKVYESVLVSKLI